jgi:hypothetical protein
VQHRDGELETLLHAERQAVGTRIDDGLEVVALEQFLNSRADLLFRQMIEFGMQQEVLRDRQFAVKRKGLRHVADVVPRLHVVRAHWLAEELVELLKHLRIDLQLHSEHQLGAFVRGLHRLRGELGVGGDKADFCRNNVVGDGIEDNASLVADRQFARIGRRQEEGHINVGQVEDCDDRRTGGDDLAGSRKLILHAPNRGDTRVRSSMID